MRAYPKEPFGPQNITEDDCNRQAFIHGYEQAEKDLALTADEIRLIFNKVLTKQSMYNTTEGCYQEVADWFNSQREKK